MKKLIISNSLSAFISALHEFLLAASNKNLTGVKKRQLISHLLQSFVRSDYFDFP